MREPVFEVDGKVFQNVGEYLRDNVNRLKAAGIADISLTRIAREAQIAPSTVSRWMTNQNKPYWDSVQRLRNVIDGYWKRAG